MNKVRLSQSIILTIFTALFFFFKGAFVLKPVRGFQLNPQPEISNFQENTVGIYLINLDRAKLRLKNIMPLAEKIGLQVNRISAIDGKDLFNDYINSVIDLKSYMNFLSQEPEKGTIGCYLSHIKAWQEFLKSTYQYALILEDDVSFDPVQINQVTLALLKKSNLWDICSFEILHRGWPIKITNLINDIELVKYRFKVTHTGTYIINRKAAIQLLKYALPIKMPVDHYFNRNWELHLKFTGLEPRISHQTGGNSYIQNPNQKLRRSNSIPRAIYEIKSGVMRFIYNF